MSVLNRKRDNAVYRVNLSRNEKMALLMFILHVYNVCDQYVCKNVHQGVVITNLFSVQVKQPNYDDVCS